MWPIFWPDDTRFSYPPNTRHPSEDFDADGKNVAERVTAVVAATGTCADPRGYGQIVARQLFADLLPYGRHTSRTTKMPRLAATVPGLTTSSQQVTWSTAWTSRESSASMRRHASSVGTASSSTPRRPASSVTSGMIGSDP